MTELEKMGEIDTTTVPTDALRLICDAIIDNPIDFEENLNGPDYFRCRFCNDYTHTTQSKDSVKHSENCAFLIALKIHPDYN